MSAHRVRSARSDDAAAIAALVASATELQQVAPQESYPLTADVVAHWLSSREGCHVLELDGEILAYGELNPDASRRSVWWVGHVVVQPQRRGGGLGRELVGALARAAAENHQAQAVWISVFADNPAALRAYQAVGFRIENRRRFLGRELIDLQLWLDADARALSRRTAAIFCGFAGLLTLGLLPGDLRAALVAELRLPWWLVGLGCLLSSVMAGLAWRRILPKPRARGIAPLLRPMLYGLATASTLGLVWSLADLGLRSERIWDPLRALALGLQYGAGWGLAAIFLCQLSGRMRSLPPPGPLPPSDGIPR